MSKPLNSKLLTIMEFLSVWFQILSHLNFVYIFAQLNFLNLSPFPDFIQLKRCEGYRASTSNNKF